MKKISHCEKNYIHITRVLSYRGDFSIGYCIHIEFIDADSNIDFDKEMSRIQKDFKKLLKDENQCQEQLIEAFKKLGYDKIWYYIMYYSIK